MSYYPSKLVLSAKKTSRKCAIYFFMFLHRCITGHLADRLFGFFNLFGNKPHALPPVRNSLLLNTAVDLASKIRKKQVSCVSVVQAYIDRIDEVGPVINAVVDERKAKALEEASSIDQLLRTGTKTEQELEREFPLLGVPVSVKEAIGVEGMLFTTGCVKRRGVRAGEDAEVVRRLRKAGAIPLANTNTSEQCFWMESYNALYGMTNNPYDTNRTAGGSSGGEGALLASAGSVAGVGNDIGGSIRIPAIYNGIFGHKPSRGIVPNEGAFPPTEKVLQPYIGTGPMCRYASDLLPLLCVMAGSNASLLRLDKKVELKDLKICYMEDDGGNSFTLPPKEGVKDALRKVINHFGSICVAPPQKVHIRGLNHGFQVWGHALCANIIDTETIEKRVFGDDEGASPWKELLLSVFRRSNYTFPIIATILVERYLAPKKKSDAEPFTRIQHYLESDFQSLLQDNYVFIMPTMPEPAPYHYANLLRAQNCGYVALFNVLGLPATHCPVGLDKEGLPVGVQVVCGMRNDHINFAVAREIERVFGGWECPCDVDGGVL